eukprot:9184352-Alexandrium_andersonii.AAC.1
MCIRDSFSFACPECLKVHTVDARPQKLARGWPQWYCSGCKTQRRLGSVRCQACSLELKSCRCGLAPL